MTITKTETGYKVEQRTRASSTRHGRTLETVESETLAGALELIAVRLARYAGMTWPRLGHAWRPGCHCGRDHSDFLCARYLSIDGWPTECLAPAKAH